MDLVLVCEIREADIPEIYYFTLLLKMNIKNARPSLVGKNYNIQSILIIWTLDTGNQRLCKHIVLNILILLILQEILVLDIYWNSLTHSVMHF